MRQRAAERTTRRWTPSEANAVFELENGSRMDQKTFHALYLKAPEGFRAELIGGVVYVMSSPVSPRHGRAHFRTLHWLGFYADETPGTDVLDNTTSILGGESESQPDACLLVLPEYGGRATVVEDKHISGPLDLVVEVANSSRAIDLGAKKRDYEQAGVREYVVVLVRERAVRWFHHTDTGFVEAPAGGDGLFRSAVFPGLWLDPRGLFSATTRPLRAAVRQGLATPEHAAFVAELAARRKKSRPAGNKPRRKNK
jgi:Uma2 family endonuclease